MMLMYGNDMESAANKWHKRTEGDNSTGVSMGLGSDDDLLACVNVGRLGRINTPTVRALKDVHRVFLVFNFFLKTLLAMFLGYFCKDM